MYQLIKPGTLSITSGGKTSKERVTRNKWSSIYLGIKHAQFFGQIQEKHQNDHLILGRQIIWPTLPFFIWVSFGAHCPIFNQSYCSVTKVGEIPLLDYVTLIFYKTGSFFPNKKSDKRSDFFLRRKFCTWIQFSHQFFFTMIKKRAVRYWYESSVMMQLSRMRSIFLALHESQTSVRW